MAPAPEAATTTIRKESILMLPPRNRLPSARVLRFSAPSGGSATPPLALEDLPLLQPGPGEVRLRVRAFSLHRSPSDGPSPIGYEAAGIVEAIGPGVDQALIGRLRSTVPAFSFQEFSTCGEVATVPSAALAAFPETFNFVQAASLWTPFLTAWAALCHTVRLAPGDSVLVEHPNLPVGLAALQIARLQGASAIAVTPDPALRQTLLDLDPSLAVVSSTTGWTAASRGGSTPGQNRVLLDPLAGSMLVGLPDDADPPLAPRHTTADDLTPRTALADPQRRRDAEHYISDGLLHGALHPLPSVTFSLAAFAQAQAALEAGQDLGVIVLTVP